MGLKWILESCKDMNDSARMNLFQNRLLQMDPATLTLAGFQCVDRYFRECNILERNMGTANVKFF